MTVLVTDCACFIGANFVLDWLATSSEPVFNLDERTYAAKPETLVSSFRTDHTRRTVIPPRFVG
jgi:dTDP-glucose 4,6-dehydratase